jgi:hypothetical protein
MFETALDSMSGQRAVYTGIPLSSILNLESGKESLVPISRG